LKVGILTFHEVYNPGAFWQAYATCQMVRELGHEPVVINYTHPDHRFRPLRRLLSRHGLKHPRHWFDCYRKNEVFERSRLTLLPLSRRFVSHQDLSSEPFDAVLVGADIVWDFRNPNLGKDPVYFGESLKTTQLISWAASMGGCALEGDIPRFVKEGIPKFKAISVRDKKTGELVGMVSEHIAQVLFDPALSLDINAVPRGVAPKRPYIAVYTIPDLVTPDFVAQAKAFAADKGLPLYAVTYRNKWVDRNFVVVSPEDWVSLLDQAEYVVTNTFHGTIFSILLGKRFAMEYNPAIESKTRGMMEYLGLDSRVVGSDASMESILSSVWNREEVHGIIRERVAEARNYLTNALS
jgi:hypothetical protein